MRRRRFGAGVAVVLLGASGCASTTYAPRPDGRVTITFEDGARRFTKNGASVPATMDNLQQVVADNPDAAAEARQSAGDFRTGFVLDLGGLAATLGGAFVIVPGTNPDGTRRPVSDARAAAGGALMLGGLIAIFGALHYLTSAQARQLDAINIYNDGVGAWPPPGAAAPPAVVSPLPLPPPTVVPAAPTPPAQ